MPKPVKLISLLKAKQGVSKEEFKRHLLEEQSPLIMKFKNLKGYRINIAIEEYQEIEGGLPYDGTAELCWDSIKEMKEDFASSAADKALADADSFMHMINIFSEEYIIKNITAEI